MVSQLSRPSEPGERLCSDAEVIGVSLREPSSFATLFDRHAAEIARYVSARIGPDLADDVTAETFLAASGTGIDTTGTGPTPARGCTASRYTRSHRTGAPRRVTAS